MTTSKRQRVLVTGATGYVGGRLVPLCWRGYRVRVLVRDLDRLEGRSWRDQVEFARVTCWTRNVAGRLRRRRRGLLPNPQHAQPRRVSVGRDLRAARNFAEAAAARASGASSTSGGLGQSATGLSEHLRSRQETGAALREAGVPMTEFRASILVGSGSVSFEMIRNLTERLPMMICPRWVYTRTQPIAIDDALAYLVAALETPESQGQIIEIGGRDVLTYKEMMSTYARVRGLRRMHPPRSRADAAPLFLLGASGDADSQHDCPTADSGLGVEVIVTDDLAHRLFPRSPIDYETAVARALSSLEASDVETSWSDALVSSQGDTRPVIFTTQEGMLIEQRQRVVEDPPVAVFAEFAALGGRRGWLRTTGYGAGAARWTVLSGASGFAGGGATQSICASGTPSISGASKPSRPAIRCGCGQR